MTLRKYLKLLHTLGSVGLTGALLALLVLHAQLPEPDQLPEYAALRAAMEAVADWMLFPSLGLVLVSGLLSMAMTHAFHNAGWAWLKLLLGVSMFEGTLITVQGPAEAEAALVSRVLAGGAEVAELGARLQQEWNSLWVVLAIAVVNIVLGVWRPRKRRSAG